MRQKGKFLTFCFSLFPGAGHMYLGFMKMGVSVMTLFWGIVMLGVLMNLGILYFILPVIWCYSFFDVINKNSMTEEEFYELEDNYLFNFEISDFSSLLKGKNRNVFAAALVVIGIGMLVSNFMNFLDLILPWGLYWRVEALFRYIPRICIALLIIWVGMRLIRGKQLEMKLREKEKVFVKTEPFDEQARHADAQDDKKEQWTGTAVDMTEKIEKNMKKDTDGGV